MSRRSENSLNFHKKRKLGSICSVRAVLGSAKAIRDHWGENIPTFRACGLQPLSLDFLLVLPATEPATTWYRPGVSWTKALLFSALIATPLFTGTPIQLLLPKLPASGCRSTTSVTTRLWFHARFCQDRSVPFLTQSSLYPGPNLSGRRRHHS